MAKFKLAAFGKKISGRMSSVVYRQTRIGTEIAEFEAPRNPRTAAQTRVRTDFQKATKQWRTLTATQAQSWRDYGMSLDNTQKITSQLYKSLGFNAFVKLAAKWYAVNATGTAPATPPTTPFAGDNFGVTGSSEAAGTIQFSATAANSTSVTTALLIQRISGPNSDPVDGAYKVAKYNKFTAGVGLSTTVSVAPGYYAVGYQFVNTATGQTTSPVFQAGVIGPVSFAIAETTNKKKAA